MRGENGGTILGVTQGPRNPQIEGGRCHAKPIVRRILRAHVRRGVSTRSASITAFVTEDKEMLVLSRKQGEAIVIGGNVTVTVLEVQGNRVRLGFAAPGETPIHREEIQSRIERCTAPLAHV